jgi:hypothetical protein
MAAKLRCVVKRSGGEAILYMGASNDCWIVDGNCTWDFRVSGSLCR